MKISTHKHTCFRDGMPNGKSLYINVGVFCSFLAFSFLTFTILSPIVSSDAATNTATAGNAAYSASISTNDSTPINITPTSSQAVYTGTSAISYTSTCPYGMDVSLSSSSSDTNLTRSGTDSATKTIATISSGTALTNNSWGYSLDGGSTYNKIPASSSPANILSTSSANTTAATKNVTYGVKTDNNLPSGSYSNTMVYTLSIKPQCISYTLKWDLNNGTGASGVSYADQSVNFGDTINLLTYKPTRAGYNFDGWKSSVTNTTFSASAGATDVNPTNATTVTLTAQWTQIMAENVGYTAPSGVSCSDAQCMIEYLDDRL